MNFAAKDYVLSKTYSAPVSWHQALLDQARERGINVSERLRDLVAVGLQAEAAGMKLEPEQAP